MDKTINISRIIKMALTIDKRFTRLITAILLFIIAIPGFAAKPLKDKDRQRLINVVRERYTETMMQGAEVIRIGGKNVLVTVVGTKSGPNSQRMAQVKAARAAGEYLQASSNKSLTVYEVTDNQSYKLSDKASASGSSHNSATSSNISQKTDDASTIETSEKFTDRMVQTSFTQVNHIEPLCNLGSVAGEIVYAYYMIIE